MQFAEASALLISSTCSHFALLRLLRVEHDHVSDGGVVRGEDGLVSGMSLIVCESLRASKGAVDGHIIGLLSPLHVEGHTVTADLRDLRRQCAGFSDDGGNLLLGDLGAELKQNDMLDHRWTSPSTALPWVNLDDPCCRR
jgi:hypothetical protein